MTTRHPKSAKWRPLRSLIAWPVQSRIVWLNPEKLVEAEKICSTSAAPGVCTQQLPTVPRAVAGPIRATANLGVGDGGSFIRTEEGPLVASYGTLIPVICNTPKEPS
ncbi:MAG: hypothetical protein B5766_05390 [Candidatus Lumbricidophila eiseniae]|uniref:Uncharacterized protein n=1 Tax=Candidatus Lumbricidiphila eiseniae TaxID=1969409 RepID=A0A2A6FS43_9MICO|nr:MAG: hypothetical protein B5766_05390 [Candidatus Lumbricidophila eiseniae]